MFLRDRPFLAFASLDDNGRPWVTVVTRHGGPLIQVTGPNAMLLHGVASENDPVARCLRTAVGDHTPWAALGINFADRDRVIALGTLHAASVTPLAPGLVAVDAQLSFIAGLGNCPKYIPVAHVSMRPPVATAAITGSAAPAPIEEATGSVLGTDALGLVQRSDRFFLATRHCEEAGAAACPSASMHINFRGGPPGFVRAFAGPDGGSVLAWPDYSGNRFYMSLGNIESDGVAGAVFVDWETGDALHITGRASVLIGDAALELMPRAATVVTISVTAHVLLRCSIAVAGGSTIEPSPYCPPVRFLASELAVGGRVAPALAVATAARSRIATADVVSVARVTPDMATFTLRLRDGATLAYRPGQFVVLDFSTAVPPRTYAHMNAAKPQALNDDLVRSYTISGTPRALESSGDVPGGGFAPENELAITVKLKQGGTASTLLHEWAAARVIVPADADVPLLAPLVLPVLGIGGEFSVFPPPQLGSPTPVFSPDAGPGNAVLFIAAGSGVTPFMSMLRAVARIPAPLRPSLHMLLSTRSADALLGEMVASLARDAGAYFTHFVTDAGAASATVQAAGFSECALQADPSSSRRVLCRRMTQADIAEAAAAASHGVPFVSAARRNTAAWVCGPVDFMGIVGSWLEVARVAPVHSESFSF